ncbi:hypothetical protein ACFL4G_05200 [Thermodesulfobacteriota bacterium]
MVKIFAELAKHWRPGKPLPIIIFVNSLPRETLDKICSGEKANIHDLTLEYLRAPQPNITKVPPDFINLLQSKWNILRPVVLFDAVDECADKVRYEKMVNTLSDAGHALRSIGTVVISCREGDYSKRTNFIPIRILSLTQRQIITHYKRKGIRHQRVIEGGLKQEQALLHLSHYLINVYFLQLYLNWLLSEDIAGNTPVALPSLFEEMFIRELKKIREVQPVPVEAGRYLQDALSPIAYIWTLSSMPYSNVRVKPTHTAGLVGLPSWSPDLLKAMVIQPTEPGVLHGWRKYLWDYLQTNRQSDAIALGRIVATDTQFEQLIKENPFQQGRDPHYLAIEILRWAREFDFPVPETEQAILGKNIQEILFQQPTDTECVFAAFQFVLSFRALGWAVKTAILRMDQKSGYILRFRHQRIREYLTAQYIDAMCLTDFLQRAHVDNSWWRQTVNMLAAVTNSPSDFLSYILGNQEGNKERANLIPGQVYEPWRILVASQCAQYLPLNSRRACTQELEKTADALHDLAFSKKAQNEVDQVLAVAELGATTACGIIKPSDGLIRNMANMVRNTSTRQKALDSIYAILKVGRPRFITFIIAISSILYGLMFCDPEEVLRPIGRRPSLSVRLVLDFLAWFGEWIRIIPVILWALLFPIWLIFLLTQSIVNHSFSFWLLGFLLICLAIDRTIFTGSWAYSVYRILAIPVEAIFWLCNYILNLLKILSEYIQKAIRNIKSICFAIGRTAQSFGLAVNNIGRLLSNFIHGAFHLLTRLPRMAGQKAVAVFSWIPTLFRKLISRTRSPKINISPKSYQKKATITISPQLPLFSFEGYFTDLFSFMRRVGRALFLLPGQFVRHATIWSGRQWRMIVLLFAASSALVLIYFLVLPWLSFQVARWWTLRDYNSLRNSVQTGYNGMHAVATSSIMAELEVVEKELDSPNQSPSDLLNRLEKLNYDKNRIDLLRMKRNIQTLTELMTVVKDRYNELNNRLIKIQVDKPWEITELEQLIDLLVEEYRSATNHLNTAEEAFSRIELRRRFLDDYLILMAELDDFMNKVEGPINNIDDLMKSMEMLREKVDNWRSYDVQWHTASFRDNIIIWINELNSSMTQVESEIKKAKLLIHKQLLTETETIEPVSVTRMRHTEPKELPQTQDIAERRSAIIPGPLLEFTNTQLNSLETKVKGLEDKSFDLLNTLPEIPLKTSRYTLKLLLNLETFNESIRNLTKTSTQLAIEIVATQANVEVLRERFPDSASNEIASWHKQTSNELNKIQRTLEETQRKLQDKRDHVFNIIEDVVNIVSQHFDTDIEHWRQVVSDATRYKDELSNLSLIFNELEQQIKNLELQTRNIPRGDTSWWRGHGGDLLDRLQHIRNNFEKQTIIIQELDDKDIQSRVLKISKEARSFAQDALYISGQRIIREKELRRTFIRIGDRIADSRILVLSEEISQSLITISSGLKRKIEMLELQLNEISLRVTAAKRSAFLYTGISIVVFAIVMVPIIFLISSSFKSMQIKRFLSNYQGKNESEKRDYLLTGIIKQRLMSVREVALQELEDMALSSSKDFKKLIKVKTQLDKREKRGDQECGARLIGIAADIKMRIQRTIGTEA